MTMPAATAVRKCGLNFDGDGWDQSPTGLLVPPKRRWKFDRPIGIDLFAGAGGFSLGMKQAGFHMIAANESDPHAALTYMTNLGTYPCEFKFVSDDDEAAMEKALSRSYGLNGQKPASRRGHTVKEPEESPVHRASQSGSGWILNARDEDGQRYPGTPLMIVGDVRELHAADFLDPFGLEPGEVDVVVGGPPCQGFSISGQRNVADPRNNLVFEFARLICEIQPKSMVMENVPGIMSMRTADGRSVVDEFCAIIERGDYAAHEATSRALLARTDAGHVRRGGKAEEPEADEDESDQLAMEIS